MDPLPHRAQWYGISLVWIFMWQFFGLWCGVWLYITHFILMVRNNTFFQYISMLPSSHSSLYFRFKKILTAMTSQQKSTWSCLKHLKSTLWQCFIRICCVNPFSGEFVQLHWSQLNFSKLLSVLESLAPSPLTISASFSAADCSLSEKESSRLIVSSASPLPKWK